MAGEMKVEAGGWGGKAGRERLLAASPPLSIRSTDQATFTPHEPRATGRVFRGRALLRRPSRAHICARFHVSTFDRPCMCDRMPVSMLVPRSGAWACRAAFAIVTTEPKCASRIASRSIAI